MTPTAKHFLELEANRWRQLGSPHTLTEVFLQLGHEGQARRLPVGVKAGPMKNCFANAQKLAKKKGYHYVEGYAASGATTSSTLAALEEHGANFHMLLVHHGWFEDDQGNVIDNTWFDPAHSLYHGITIPPDLIPRGEGWSVLIQDEMFLRRDVLEALGWKG